MNKHMNEPQVAPGTTVEWLHSTYKILLTPEQTNGQLGLFETLGAPESGPPLHVHHQEDETFYILQGEVTFWLEGQTVTKGAGETMFVPRGKEHTYHVVGPNPARMLVMMTPGGFEAFFVAMAAGTYRIPEDMPKVVETAWTYNLEFTGPPLKA